jgi:hypothetical protein
MYTEFHSDESGYKIIQYIKKHVKNLYHKTPPIYKNNEVSFLRFFYIF